MATAALNSAPDSLAAVSAEKSQPKRQELLRVAVRELVKR